MGLKKTDFYYDLPPELIAQDPLLDRTASRLMVLDKNIKTIENDHFYNIKKYLKEGDCLVLNNTKVIPARLLGNREGTGGAVEILLLKRNSEDIWECLVKPGKKCRIGSRVVFGDGRLRAEVVDVIDEGNRLVRFEYEGIWEEVLDSLGEMPLPPYITHKLKDKNRYQTVYAKYEGSAAAPTAGLHFTDSLLSEIKDMGVNIVYVTLHVGLGTFRPVKEDELSNHHMHSEFCTVTNDSADIINNAKRNGNRVICVGTTSLRTIESLSVYVCEDGRVFSRTEVESKTGKPCDESYIKVKDCFGEGHWELKEGSSDTDIFIYPGYEFKLLDGLITNFHLPESTLIMLVSAFAGRDFVMSAYQEAVKERYRFFSFGDAMFVR